MRIAVLCGGPSSEREVSLLSGKAVFEALRAKGLDVIWVDASVDFLKTLKAERVSLAFIALHGAFGEDGEIQTILEREAIAYTGDGPRVQQRAFDKSLAQTFLRKQGVRVPDFKIFQSHEAGIDAGNFIYPVVVKPARAGSSVGISIVPEAARLEAACRQAARFSDTVLVERYIAGRELTVGFLAEEALPVVEIKPARPFYDYEAKYGESGTRYEVPAKLSAAEEAGVVNEAKKAYQALGCEVMGRVDLILAKDGRPYVLELNTIPGLTGKSLLPKAAQARGIAFDDLCAKIMEISYGKVIQNKV